MKCLVVIVTIVAALTVDGRTPGQDCPDPPCPIEPDLPDPDHQFYDGKPLLSDVLQGDLGSSNVNQGRQEIGKGHGENKLRGKGGSACKANIACTILGGTCVNNVTQCSGRLLTDGCKGKKCQCCIPGCPEGSFILPSTGQCFRLYKDRTRSWTEANATCQTDGLMMAKPYDHITLRNYLVSRYGDVIVWLGARGDGSYFRWVRDGVKIGSSHPAWWEGYPGTRVTNSSCLVFGAYESYWKSTPDTPYWDRTCTSSAYTLCELVMSDRREASSKVP